MHIDNKNVLESSLPLFSHNKINHIDLGQLALNSRGLKVPGEMYQRDICSKKFIFLLATQSFIVVIMHDIRLCL